MKDHNNCKQIAVFFFTRPISTYEVNKYDFKRFEENNIIVKVFNMGGLLLTHRPLSCDLNDREISLKYITNIKTYKHLESLLKSLPENTIYIDYIASLNDKSLWNYTFYRILKKHNIRYSIVDLGAAPIEPTFKDVSNFIYIFPKKLKPGIILSFLARKTLLFLQNYFNLLPRAEKVFALPDEVSFNHIKRHKISSESHILVNSEDYSKLVSTEIDSLGYKNYCVFIDQNFPYHKDAIDIGRDPIPPESYYESLSNYFDFVEHETGLEVIIAAHPYTKLDNNYFGERKIVYGKSLELIHDCSFAIVHDSTAIGYAVIFEKPLVFIVTDRIIEIERDFGVRQLAYPLGLKPINIDNIKEVMSLSLNFKSWKAGEKYLKFKRDYHCAVDTGLPSWQIIINTLQEK
jgi:hypothetical protein